VIDRISSLHFACLHTAVIGLTLQTKADNQFVDGMKGRSLVHTRWNTDGTSTSELALFADTQLESHLFRTPDEPVECN